MVNLLLGALLLTGSGLDGIQSCGSTYIEVHSEMNKTKKGYECNKVSRSLINASSITSIKPNGGKSIQIYVGNNPIPYFVCGTSYDDLLNNYKQRQKKEKEIDKILEKYKKQNGGVNKCDVFPEDPNCRGNTKYNNGAIPFNLYK